MKAFIKYILLLSFISSFAYSAESIYTWGYGDLMAEALKMIKSVFYVNTFTDMWKIVVAISITLASFKMLVPNNTDYFSIAKIYLVQAGVWTLFITQTLDVYVDDKVNPNYNESITSVSWAVAKPISVFSTFNKVLNEKYENATSLASTGAFGSINYSNAGMLAPLNIFKQSSSHKIIDPTLAQNIENYIIECVMPDIENGFKDYNAIMQSTNLWTYFGNTNPAIIVPYRNTDGTQSLLTCTTFYTTVNGVLNTYVTTTGLDNIAKTIGGMSSVNLASAMGTTSQYLLGVSKTATAQLMQNVAINSFENSFKTYASLNGVDSGTAAYYAGKAETTAQSNMIISGLLGSKYIPITKGILMTIVTALTPALALLMATPLAYTSIIGYFLTLLWLSMWQIGEVILNHIVLVRASQIIKNSASDYTIETKAIVDTSITDYINLASSMHWMVPTISLAIVSGFSFKVFSSLSSGMTQKAARGEMAATEAGSGNVSHGNTSHSNYSANNLSTARMVSAGNSMTMSSMSDQYSNGNYQQHGKSSMIGNPLGAGNSQLFNENDMNKINDTLGNMTGSGFGSGGNWKGAGNLNNLGNGNYGVQDPSMTLTNSSGESMTLSQGSVVKSNGDGSFSVLQSNNASYMGKDSQGNNVTMSNMEFTNGKLTEFTAKDSNGVSVTQEMRGDDVTRTGTIGNTKITETNGRVTGATIDGVNYSAEQVKAAQSNYSKVETASDIMNYTNGETNKNLTSSTEAEIGSKTIELANSNTSGQSDLKEYSKNVVSSTATSLVASAMDSLQKTENTTKTDSNTASGEVNAQANVKFDSNNSLLGKIGGWLTGLGVDASAGAKVSYDNKDTFSVQTANGKTETYTLNESEKKEFSEMVGERIASSSTNTKSTSSSDKESDTTQSQHAKSIMNETASSLMSSFSAGTSTSASSSNSFSTSDKIQHAQELAFVQNMLDNRGDKSFTDVVANVNENKLGNTSLSNNIPSTAHLNKDDIQSISNTTNTTGANQTSNQVTQDNQTPNSSTNTTGTNQTTAQVNQNDNTTPVTPNNQNVQQSNLNGNNHVTQDNQTPNNSTNTTGTNQTTSQVNQDIQTVQLSDQMNQLKNEFELAKGVTTPNLNSTTKEEIKNAVEQAHIENGPQKMETALQGGYNELQSYGWKAPGSDNINQAIANSANNADKNWNQASKSTSNFASLMKEK